MIKNSVVIALLLTSLASAQFGTYLSDKPTVSLEAGLPIALRAAHAEVPDLDKFALNSVTPRVLKGDRKGQYWQFLWQELPFKSGLRGVIVRVYMSDGSTVVQRFSE